MVASNRMDALESTTQPVQIELRIPGPWRSSEHLADALEAGETGFRLEGDHLVRESDGWQCSAGATPHDEEVAGLFAYDGRMSRKELAVVANHTAKVLLAGPGGSVAKARAMVDAATALVKLGAAGVMIDNSAATHSPTDWLTLSSDPKPGGLYWIFTSLNGGDDEVWTSGQHCLGLRDAEVRDAPDEQFAYLLVHNFLGYVYQSGKTVHNGNVIDGPSGSIYRATQHPFTRVATDAPFFNPFGLWRLTRAEEGEKWPQNSYHPIR